jgi:glutathione S-transferase
MAAKHIPFQDVDVDLQVKAEWHKEINGGLLPLMETPAGTIIYESAVIA